MSTSSTPVDRIRLSGLSARGYHGVLGSEREEGQLFVADVVMGLGPRGTAVAAVTDSIDDAVDYAEVACAVVAVIEGEPVNLIETLASRVADVVLGFGRVQEVEVTIHKPQAPVPVAFEDVTVTIARTAQDADRSLGGVAERRADGGAHLSAWSTSAPAAAQTPAVPVAPPVGTAVPAARVGAAVPAAPVGAAVPAVAPLLAGGLLGAVTGAAPEGGVIPEPVLEEPLGKAGEAEVRAQHAGAAQPEPAEEPADARQTGDWWTGEAGGTLGKAAEAAAAPPEEADEPVAPPAEDSAAGGTGLWPTPAPIEAGAALGIGAPVGGEAPAPEWGNGPAEPSAVVEPVSLSEMAGSLLPESAAPVAEPGSLLPESAAPVAEPGPLFPESAAPVAEPGPLFPEPSAPFAQPPAPAEVPVDPLSLRPAAPAQVVLALGANVGKVLPTLRTAVRTLSSLEGLTVTAVAPLARTTAVTLPGAEPQPDYLNTVLLATTTMTPRELLDVCQDLEAAAGRVRSAPWGPRTLDIDLISFEGVTSKDPALALPHPRAAERAFVLVPWSTADPFAELDGRSVAALAEAAPDREGLRWLALDWLDSDRLPALPTGEYVVPPTDDQVPAPVSAPEEAPAPVKAPASEVAPIPGAVPTAPASDAVAAPVPAPAAVPVPAEPVAPTTAPAAPAVPAAPPTPAPQAAPEPVAPAAPAEPVFSPGPAPEEDWAAPMGWDDVIRGNRS